MIRSMVEPSTYDRQICMLFMLRKSSYMYVFSFGNLNNHKKRAQSWRWTLQYFYIKYIHQSIPLDHPPLSPSYMARDNFKPQVQPFLAPEEEIVYSSESSHLLHSQEHQHQPVQNRVKVPLHFELKLFKQLQKQLKDCSHR